MARRDEQPTEPPLHWTNADSVPDWDGICLMLAASDRLGEFDAARLLGRGSSGLSEADQAVIARTVLRLPWRIESKSGPAT